MRKNKGGREIVGVGKNKGGREIVDVRKNVQVNGRLTK